MSVHANRMIPPSWMVSEDRARVGNIFGDAWRGAKSVVTITLAATHITSTSAEDTPPAPDPLDTDPNVVSQMDLDSAARTDAEIETMCAGEDPALCAYPLKQHRKDAIAKIARIGDPNVISDSDRNSAALTDAQIEAMCTPLYTIPGAVDGCRVTAQGQRADAQAKIARLTAADAGPGTGGKWAGFVRAPVSAIIDVKLAPLAQRPKTPTKAITPPPAAPASPAMTAAYVGAAPVLIGGLAAIKFGWVAIAAGGAVGVVAAGGVYAYMKLSRQP